MEHITKSMGAGSAGKFSRVNRGIKNGSGGFTLVEMLVVMFIISLMSSLLLANYRSGQKQYVLQQAAEELVSYLRYSQNKALSGSEINSGIFGYGVYFAKIHGAENYIVFRDEDGDFMLDYSSQPEDSSELYKEVDLPSNVKISWVGAPSNNELNIGFEPPDPITHIIVDSVPVSSASITLIYEGFATKIITVTETGAIEIQ